MPCPGTWPASTASAATVRWGHAALSRLHCACSRAAASLAYALRPRAALTAAPKCSPLPAPGFHGISYSYLTREAARLLGRPVAETNLIICHLGG